MQRIGPYEVHEQLGRGGMGSVHRAVDPRTGQEVALKLLAVAADPRAGRRMIGEARALARLRHPHIVSLIDAGEHQGRPWIAMELVRGGTLQDRLDARGPLPARSAARLARQLASALAHAHHEGVLHRDLKPANVMLPDGGGEARLSDFGLAGFTLDAPAWSRLTRSGMLMGSPGYWSPEQAAGKATTSDVRTDVYGLGAVLYAALAARPPIEGESLPEVLLATEQRRPAPPGSDPALAAIALRCLEKRPEDRFPTMDAVERELAAYLARRSSPGAARRGRFVAAGLSVALLALLGLVVAGLARRAPPGPTDAAPRPAEPGAAATTSTDDGRPEAPPRGADEPERLLARARAALAADDHEGALEACTRALELDPSNAAAHACRAQALVAAGDLRGATEDLDRALSRSSSSSADTDGWGRWAVAAADEVLAATPLQLDALLLRALGLEARAGARPASDGRVAADDAWALASDVDPAGFQALIDALSPSTRQAARRGAAVDEALETPPLQDLAPALRARLVGLVAAVEVSARRPLRRALLAAAEGRPLAHLAPLLDEARRAAPRSGTVAHLSARLLAGRDAYDQAIEEVQRARALGGPVAALQLLHGQALWVSGRGNEAVREWDALVRAAPDDPQGLTAAAWAYLARGDPTAALRCASAALDRAPDLEAAHTNIGDLYQVALRPLEAARAYQRAMETSGLIDAHTARMEVAVRLEAAIGGGPRERRRAAEVDACMQRLVELFSVGGAMGPLLAVSSALKLLPDGAYLGRCPAWLDEAERLEPGRAEVDMYRGRVAVHRAGSTAEDALRHWRRAREKDPRVVLPESMKAAFREVFGEHPDLATFPSR